MPRRLHPRTPEFQKTPEFRDASGLLRRSGTLLMMVNLRKHTGHLRPPMWSLVRHLSPEPTHASIVRLLRTAPLQSGGLASKARLPGASKRRLLLSFPTPVTLAGDLLRLTHPSDGLTVCDLCNDFPMTCSGDSRDAIKAR